MVSPLRTEISGTRLNTQKIRVNFDHSTGRGYSLDPCRPTRSRAGRCIRSDPLHRAPRRRLYTSSAPRSIYMSSKRKRSKLDASVRDYTHHITGIFKCVFETHLGNIAITKNTATMDVLCFVYASSDMFAYFFDNRYCANKTHSKRHFATPEAFLQCRCNDTLCFEQCFPSTSNATSMVGFALPRYFEVAEYDKGAQETTLLYDVCNGLNCLPWVHKTLFVNSPRVLDNAVKEMNALHSVACKYPPFQTNFKVLYNMMLLFLHANVIFLDHYMAHTENRPYMVHATPFEGNQFTPPARTNLSPGAVCLQQDLPEVSAAASADVEEADASAQAHRETCDSQCTLVPYYRAEAGATSQAILAEALAQHTKVTAMHNLLANALETAQGGWDQLESNYNALKVKYDTVIAERDQQADTIEQLQTHVNALRAQLSQIAAVLRL